MLDIKFIRENKDLIAAGAKKKHIEFDVDALLVLDDKRRELLGLIEKKRVALFNLITVTFPSGFLTSEKRSLKPAIDPCCAKADRLNNATTA